MNRLTVGLLATFVALLLGSGLLAYVLRDRTAPAPADVSVQHSEKGDKGANATATAEEQERTERIWWYLLFAGLLLLGLEPLLANREAAGVGA